MFGSFENDTFNPNVNKNIYSVLVLEVTLCCVYSSEAYSGFLIETSRNSANPGMTREQKKKSQLLLCVALLVAHTDTHTIPLL